MRLLEGAEVFSADGEKIGTLERVVINPETDEVSHLVVKKGMLFSEDKVIPIEMVDLEIGDRIALKATDQDLEDMPDYEVSHYVQRDKWNQLDYQEDEIEAVYWYPPARAWWRTAGFVGYPQPQFVVETEVNIPEGTVALKEGAEVISRDGKHIGNVERIITDPEDNRATHFVISEGFILKERKLVPTPWVMDVLEDEIHLFIKSNLFENLPEYEPTV
jgi:uncharacterized protein YrrD